MLFPLFFSNLVAHPVGIGGQAQILWVAPQQEGVLWQRNH